MTADTENRPNILHNLSLLRHSPGSQKRGGPGTEAMTARKN